MKRALLLVALIALAGCSTPIEGPGSPHIEVAAPPAAPAKPVSISIPKLAVTDEIVPVGLNDDGSLQIPDVTETGWYSGSPVPGAAGPALIASHVSYKGVPGALARLGELKPGDRIETTNTDGDQVVFEVYQVDEQKKTAVDWVSVLADRPGPELAIVTCSGRLIGHSFDSNTIVKARLNP